MPTVHCTGVGITQERQAACSPHPPSGAVLRAALRPCESWAQKYSPAEQRWLRAVGSTTTPIASPTTCCRSVGTATPAGTRAAWGPAFSGATPAIGTCGYPEQRHIPEDTKDIGVPAIPWLFPFQNFGTPTLTKWQWLYGSHVPVRWWYRFLTGIITTGLLQWCSGLLPRGLLYWNDPTSCM